MKTKVQIVREEWGSYCVFTLGNGSTYDVPLFKRNKNDGGIETERDLISWIQHLGAKRWACKNTLRSFISTVVAEKGWSKTGVIST